MFGSAMLDVAIGMIFVFLLLSLICSAFNELLETWLKKRASNLESGIKELLGGKTGLVEKLYNHGLVYSLYRGSYADAVKNKTLPSYIPSQNFAGAITAILSPESGAIPTGEDIRNAINKIPSDQVKSALTTPLNESENDVKKFRAAVEGWFNSAMDRVSGWYKRRTHVIIFVIGFAIAVAMNVNSISLAQDLWTNKAKRDALVGAAQGYLKEHPPAASGGNSTVLDAGLQGDLEELNKTNLPIGWTRDLLKTFCADPALWLKAILGWLLTACAASMGAPFWFDLLGKIVTVRSSIKPKEEPAPAK